jgi:hypothetical protein
LQRRLPKEVFKNHFSWIFHDKTFILRTLFDGDIQN